MKKALFPVMALIIVLALVSALVGSVGAAVLGSLEILKQDEDGAALYGATFVITPDPQDTSGTGQLTVVDNGLNDADLADGVLLVEDCVVHGSREYTVTETVAPQGYQAASPQSGIKIPSPAKVTLTFIDETTVVGGEALPVNKVGVYAPWIGLAVLVIAGGVVWLRLRRRST